MNHKCESYRGMSYTTGFLDALDDYFGKGWDKDNEGKG